MKMRYKVVESMCKDVKKHVQEKLEGQKAKKCEKNPQLKETRGQERRK